ncbi:TylF/MycF/NovP-related O-methyltransferase [Micromonospora sp. DT227]|uniref:TylF/MycF/NovP-related O-methyltransferase n=1 Tax=Micromonospora sp. DT227 TaxID=3393433 RepID=UPI003CF45C07
MTAGPALRLCTRAYRALPRSARHFLREVTTGRPFVTLSPHLTIAVHWAFRRLAERAGGGGPDLFAGAAYYEFGVYRGYSLWYAEQISRTYAPDNFRCLGFDSFAGLPSSESDGAHYRRGDFAAGLDEVVGNLRAHGADFDRLRLFPGFYSRQLFARFAAEFEFPPAAVCVIDVDTYESCLEVLRFMHPRWRPGSIVVFDDYNDMGASDEHGERRALREYLAEHPGLRVTHLRDVGHEAAIFEVSSV